MATLTLLPDTGHQHSQGTNNHGHHHAKQKCTSATCCSPSRLWRSIQEHIGTNNKHDLIALCQDPNRKPHVLRVLLTSRLTNDASLYPASNKHRVLQLKPTGDTPPLQYRAKVNAMFGKSATDLNALQLALFNRQEGIACYLLQLIRQDASEKDRMLFVNHLWGAGNGSLHLACFLGMSRVVQLLLEMGVAPDSLNQKRKSPLDCCLETQDASSLDCRTLIDQALAIKNGRKLSVDTSSPSPSTALVVPPLDQAEKVSLDDGTPSVVKRVKTSSSGMDQPMVAASPPTLWSHSPIFQVHSYDPMGGAGFLDSTPTFLAHHSLKRKQSSPTMGLVPPLVDFVPPVFEEEDDDDEDDDDDYGDEDDDGDDYGKKYQDITWSPTLLPMVDPFANYGHGNDDELNHDVLSLPLVLDPLGISLTPHARTGFSLDGVDHEPDLATLDIEPDLATMDNGTGDSPLDEDGCPKTMGGGDTLLDGDGDSNKMDYDADSSGPGCIDDDPEKQHHPGETPLFLDPGINPLQACYNGDPATTQFGKADTLGDQGGGGDSNRALLLLMATMLGSVIQNQQPLDSGQNHSHSDGWAFLHMAAFKNHPDPGPMDALIDLFAETNDGRNHKKSKENGLDRQLIRTFTQDKQTRRVLTRRCYSSERLGVLHTSLVDAYT